ILVERSEYEVISFLRFPRSWVAGDSKRECNTGNPARHVCSLKPAITCGGLLRAMEKKRVEVRATIDQDTANTLIRRIADLSLAMDKMNIAEYVEFLRNPRRIIYVNFLGGLARGFGIGIGATVLAAVFLLVLSRLVQLNLPVIGRFIAEIVKIVSEHLRVR
ncbi:MAG: DUF5665 domain-containing protein, partial [Bacillota bacterium]